jgi:hypothetical protein
VEQGVEQGVEKLPDLAQRNRPRPVAANTHVLVFLGSRSAPQKLAGVAFCIRQIQARFFWPSLQPTLFVGLSLPWISLLTASSVPFVLALWLPPLA